MSCSAQYVRMAMTLKILQVLIILPLKMYKFTKNNSTHGNFVQWQLDPRQFRPRTTRPTAISSKDNSTHGNFVQGQLDPRQFRPRTTRPTAISSEDKSTNGNFVHIQSWLSLQGLVEGHPPPSWVLLETTRPKVISPKSNCVRFPVTYT